MSILFKPLLVLLVVRLLMPPGICVCQHSALASRLCAEALGGEHQREPEPSEDDHDHIPGCPASDLAAGMGLMPAGPPLPSLDCQQVSPGLPITLLVSAPPGPARMAAGPREALLHFLPGHLVPLAS